MSTNDIRQASVADEAVANLITALSQTARSYGYALAIHGSLKRDIDLIGVPWIAEASPAWELAAALRMTAEAVWGFAHPREGDPFQKPHGRLCWAWDLVWGNLYIDLSVTPRLEE